MARRGQDAAKTINSDTVADAIAKSVADGDIVNFRLLFASFSPARLDSVEEFSDEKYAYLLPSDEERREPAFAEALKSVRGPQTWPLIERELGAKRPAQLPSELVLLLGDNAVRLGKWTSASQAYELLRVRRRMQEEFVKQGLAALELGGIDRAVRGVRIGASLAYDYAAFPEPMPMVPQYQSKALMLHALYPVRAEDCLALLEPGAHVQAAINYLLFDMATAARLESTPLERRVEFVKALVDEIDPDWKEFVSRFEAASRLTLEFGERSRRLGRHEDETLADEVEEQRSVDPWEITRALLGRDIPGASWWQYLKELAYEHPASILFISRQVIGDHEVLMPRLRAGAPLARALGLAEVTAETAANR
jgi:hypothetical protein